MSGIKMPGPDILRMAEQLAAHMDELGCSLSDLFVVAREGEFEVFHDPNPDDQPVDVWVHADHANPEGKP